MGEPRGTSKTGVWGLEVDLLDTRATEEATRRTTEELGGLYALVNLVGGFAAGTLARTPEETWDRMMNLKSTFLATHAALEYVPNGGWIVNVGTAAVTNKAPGFAAYVASKGGS